MKQKKTFLGKKSWQTVCFPVTSLVIIAAINFDGFWHVSIGRDSLFIPPHLILYSGLVFLFIFLYKTKGSVPKITWLLAALVVISGPFDDWWHTNFGVEQINDLLIVWSPPHLMVELSLIGLFLIVLKKLVIQNAKFSLTLQWAAIFSLVLITLMPLDLLSPYQVLGVFGGLINIFVIGFLVYTYFELRRSYLFPLLVVMFLLSIPLYLQEGPITDFEKFHEHLPIITLAVIFLGPAAIVDIFGVTKSNLFKTTLFLLAYVGIFLGGHVLLIDGYRQFWYVLPVFGIIAYPSALFSYKILNRIDPTGKKLHNVA
ncbi:MAG: hypothetical protein IH841_08345 [Thaumarchaeota archaeon]|nr:hypothetical protein [Nitrososphaerota archaeon]